MDMEDPANMISVISSVFIIIIDLALGIFLFSPMKFVPTA